MINTMELVVIIIVINYCNNYYYYDDDIHQYLIDYMIYRLLILKIDVDYNNNYLILFLLFKHDYSFYYHNHCVIEFNYISLFYSSPDFSIIFFFFS